MKKSIIQGNSKEYYINIGNESYLEIWRFEDNFIIEEEDLPYLKEAIKLFDKELKRVNKDNRNYRRIWIKGHYQKRKLNNKIVKKWIKGYWRKKKTFWEKW